MSAEQTEAVAEPGGRSEDERNVIDTAPTASTLLVPSRRPREPGSSMMIGIWDDEGRLEHRHHAVECGLPRR